MESCGISTVTIKYSFAANNKRVTDLAMARGFDEHSAIFVKSIGISERKIDLFINEESSNLAFSCLITAVGFVFWYTYRNEIFSLHLRFKIQDRYVGMFFISPRQLQKFNYCGSINTCYSLINV